MLLSFSSSASFTRFVTYYFVFLNATFFCFFSANFIKFVTYYYVFLNVTFFGVFLCNFYQICSILLWFFFNYTIFVFSSSFTNHYFFFKCYLLRDFFYCKCYQICSWYYVSQVLIIRKHSITNKSNRQKMNQPACDGDRELLIFFPYQ